MSHRPFPEPPPAKWHWPIAVAVGVLAFLGYVGFDQGYLHWFFLVPFLWMVRDASPGRAFALGWVAASVSMLGAMPWIAYAVHQFSGASRPVALAALVGITAFHGLFGGAIAWAVRRLAIRTDLPMAWSLPFAWVAVEFVFPFLFPFQLGAAQYRLSTLIQVADVTGQAGLSFLVVLANGALYETLRTRRLAPVAGMLALLAVTILYGFVRIQQMEGRAAVAPRLEVGLVQAGIGAREAHRDPAAYARRHHRLTHELAGAADLDLVVWPETVVRMSLAAGETAAGRRVLAPTGLPTLFGALVDEAAPEGNRLFGSAILAGPDGVALARYDKRKRVPFGEYLPVVDSVLDRAPSLAREVGNRRLVAGAEDDPIVFDGRGLAVTICYESLFPGVTRRTFGHEPVPELLVNLTNDSWYGNGHEPKQHLVLASLRTIEFRRAMARATNTGISGFVGPTGRILARTRLDAEATLAGNLPLLDGRTVYARLGDWLAWMSLLAVLAGLGSGWLGSARRRIL